MNSFSQRSNAPTLQNSICFRPSRSIVHLDADAFFASVEQAADPRLRGKPIAVGSEKRGIVVSASYEARKFGIYTPMPTARARRLCPRLIVLPGDFEKYERFSRWMFSYAYDFTPDVEVDSIDEGYFDLTGARKSPIEIAEVLQTTIRQALKITVSEGIGSNKLVSQIAAKLHKPAAFFHVPFGGEIPFLHPLPNRWLPGVGPQTAARLNSAGLALIRQIAVTPLEFLSLLLGQAAPQVREFANGRDDRPVLREPAPAKSYGHQQTFDEDTTDEAFIEAVLRHMADDLMAKVREDGKSIRTLTVKVRYNDMTEDQRSYSLDEPTDLESDVYGRLRLLLKEAWKRRVSVRLVSLKFSNVYDGFVQMKLLDDAPPYAPSADVVKHRLREAAPDQPYDARHRLAGAVDQLRKTHGKHVILRGHDFALRARNRSSTLPFFQPSFHLPSTRPHSHERGYVPLCVRSYYSFLDSTLSIDAIIELAKRHELSAIALTDKKNLHGAVEFVQKAKAAGIKPILGAEVEVEGKPVLLYVENEAGYRNLCRILNHNEKLPQERPVYSNPATNRDKLRRSGIGKNMSLLTELSTGGLIAISSDPTLADRFPGRFYRADEIACPSIHYAAPSDRWKYDIVQSIRTLTLLRQEHPGKRFDGAFHFPSPTELREWFRGNDRPLALTREIAGRCEFDFEFGKLQFPAYSPPDGSPPREFLRRLVFDGLHRRYRSEIENRKSQIEEELAIIHEVGYEEYFLVVWDLLQECRRHGIDWITRGSAADSLVCYCLGISDVCPIRFELYFRRFLNKERMKLNKLPDIDVDFPHDRKDDVINLIFDKYGPEHAAVVGGFSTYQARSALADVLKVLGVSEYQARRFTERVPHVHARDAQAAVEARVECRDLPASEEPYATALKMAQFLDGFPRFPKMHPCGVVLSRAPMADLVPCFTSNKGYPTTHFDMDAVEAIGLVKIDILAQGGLAMIRDVKEYLSAQVPERQSKQALPQPDTQALGHSCTLDLHALEPWDDAAVWEMIANGGARAVHHIESPAMISLCRMCNVRDIDGLIAIVSVIRPGAANEGKKQQFARRYQKLEPIAYPHPSLESCLRSTFGLVVYEEHILQICESFAGLPPDRADLLRRGLVKGNRELVNEIGKDFVRSAQKNGRTEAEMDAVWKLLCGFNGYAFCKAHSAAYGVEAYQSAWLKLHYPAEFMAAVLSNGKGFYQPLVYVLECHRLGIPLLAPWVNEPGPKFGVVYRAADLQSAASPISNRQDSWGTDATRRLQTCDAADRKSAVRGAIRVPATRVKGLTERTIERMVEERARGAFESLEDFYRRVLPYKDEMELLMRAGAFDGFGQTRTAQFWQIQHLCHNERANPTPNQTTLFASSHKDRVPEVMLTEPTHLQKLQWEAELLDFPASGHPLELHDDIAWNTYCRLADLEKFVGETVTCCGLIVEDRVHEQVTGELMKFMTIADWSGMVETELFASTYKSYGLATVRYPVLEITARVEPFENGRGISLRVLRAGKPRTKS